MKISLNNQHQQVTEQTSVLQLLHQFIGEKQNGIAIAINDTVIPKKQWEIYMLQTNDKVLIIKASQGG